MVTCERIIPDNECDYDEAVEALCDLAVETYSNIGNDNSDFNSGETPAPPCFQLTAMSRQILNIKPQGKQMTWAIKCPDIKCLVNLHSMEENGSLHSHVKEFLLLHEDVRNEHQIDDIEVDVNLNTEDYYNCFRFHIKKSKFNFQPEYTDRIAFQ